jgi:hypothetical protein
VVDGELFELDDALPIMQLTLTNEYGATSVQVPLIPSRNRPTPPRIEIVVDMHAPGRSRHQGRHGSVAALRRQRGSVGADALK